MPRYLQVWEKNRKLKSFNLSALEKHGPVYEDGEAPGW
jgi:acylaminoacyl-peptidase